MASRSEGERDWYEPARDTDAAAPQPPAPLHRPHDEWYGRESFLDDVVPVLMAGRSVAFWGELGVGKSTLMVEACRRAGLVSDNGDDAGTSASDEPVTTASVDGRVTDLGFATLFDNVPPMDDADGQLLLTARSRVTDARFVAFQVKPFSTAEPDPPAARFLAGCAAEQERPLTTEELDSAARLASELGGNPLAIALAASRLDLLTAGAVLESRDRMDFLRTTNPRFLPRHRNFLRAFEETLETLGADERRVLIVLSCCTGSMTVGALAEILGEMNLSATAEALSALYHRGLVERRGDSEPRLRVRKPFAEAVRRVIGEGERKSAQRTKGEYFMQRLRTLPGVRSAGATEALQWMVNLREEIESAVTDPDSPPALRATIAAAYGEYAIAHAPGAALADVLGEALLAAQAAGDADSECRIRLSHAWCLAVSSDYGAAERSLSYVLTLGAPPHRARAMIIQARILGWRGCYEEMEAVLTKAESFFEDGETTDVLIAADAQRCRLSATIFRGKGHLASADFEAVASDYRRAGDEHAVSMVRLEYGVALLQQGDPKTLVDWFSDSSSRPSETLYPRDHAHTSMNLGVALIELGRFQEAVSTLSSAARIMDRYGYQQLRALTLGNLALASLGLGNTARATQLLHEGSRLATGIDAAPTQSFLCGLRGDCALLEERPEVALAAYADAIRFTTCDDNQRWLKAHMALGLALAGRFEDARSNLDEISGWEEGTNVLHKPGRAEFERVVHGLRGLDQLARADAAGLDAVRSLLTSNASDASNCYVVGFLRRLVQRHLAQQRSLTIALASNASSEALLWVEPDALIACVDRGPCVDLRERPTHARILAHLVQRRGQAPGEPALTTALADAGWPNERMQDDSARARVKMAISALRRDGLRALILTSPAGGYYLSTECAVIGVDSYTLVELLV